MGDVRDGHDQAVPPGGQGLHEDGVVKVPCVRAIDGHQRQAAQVPPGGQILYPDPIRQPLGIGHRFGRKDIGEAGGIRDREHLLRRISPRTENTLDDPLGLCPPLRERENPRGDHLPLPNLRSAPAPQTQDLEARVAGLHERPRCIPPIDTDHALPAPSQHRLDLSLLPATPAAQGDPNAVTVEDAVELLGGQVDVVAAARVDQKESEPGAVSAHHTFDGLAQGVLRKGRRGRVAT